MHENWSRQVSVQAEREVGGCVFNAYVDLCVCVRSAKQGDSQAYNYTLVGVKLIKGAWGYQRHRKERTGEEKGGKEERKRCKTKGGNTGAPHDPLSSYQTLAFPTNTAFFISSLIAI